MVLPPIDDMVQLDNLLPKRMPTEAEILRSKIEAEILRSEFEAERKTANQKILRVQEDLG